MLTVLQVAQGSSVNYIKVESYRVEEIKTIFVSSAGEEEKEMCFSG